MSSVPGKRQKHLSNKRRSSPPRRQRHPSHAWNLRAPRFAKASNGQFVMDLAGASAPGSEIGVYIGEDRVASTTALSDGSWSLKKSIKLARAPEAIRVARLNATGEIVASTTRKVALSLQTAATVPENNADQGNQAETAKTKDTSDTTGASSGINKTKRSDQQGPQTAEDNASESNSTTDSKTQSADKTVNESDDAESDRGVDSAKSSDATTSEFSERATAEIKVRKRAAKEKGARQRAAAQSKARQRDQQRVQRVRRATTVGKTQRVKRRHVQARKNARSRVRRRKTQSTNRTARTSSPYIRNRRNGPWVGVSVTRLNRSGIRPRTARPRTYKTKHARHIRRAKN